MIKRALVMLTLWSLAACASSKHPLQTEVVRYKNGNVHVRQSFYITSSGAKVLHGDRYIYYYPGAIDGSAGGGTVEKYKDGTFIGANRFIINF
jgi:hypothetical protein